MSSNYPPIFEPRPQGDNFPIAITCLDRLKMELGHKPYCSDEEYQIFLDENKLVCSWEYDKDVMQIQLLNAVIAVLEMLANNLDLFMKIESNFITQTSALDALHRRIEHLENRIENLTEHEVESDFTFMFHTHKKTTGG